MINYVMANNKIKTGIDSKFKKGCKAGTHKRKGPSKPVGTEKICVDGYIKIKISEDKWMHKHHYVWQQHYGEIPKGYNIIFLDKNKKNFDINNLAAVSRKELLFINKKGFFIQKKYFVVFLNKKKNSPPANCPYKRIKRGWLV